MIQKAAFLPVKFHQKWTSNGFLTHQKAKAAHEPIFWHV